MNLIYQCFVTTGENGYVDKSDASRWFGKTDDEKLLEASKNSVKKYAENIGCDYIFQDKPDLPKDKIFNKNFMKYLWCMALCEEKFDEYEWILHIDSDIVMKSPGELPNIFDEIDKTKDFHAVNEPIGMKDYYSNPYQTTRLCLEVTKDCAYIYDFYHKLYDQMHTGVWIANRKCRKLFRENWVNTLKNKKTLDESKSTYPRPGLADADQPLINGMIHNLGISYSFLHCKWNALCGSMRPDFLKNEAYALHYADERTKIMFKYPKLLGETHLTYMFYEHFKDLI